MEFYFFLILSFISQMVKMETLTSNFNSDHRDSFSLDRMTYQRNLKYSHWSEMTKVNKNV
jgi:hypothetical protein